MEIAESKLGSSTIGAAINLSKVTFIWQNVTLVHLNNIVFAITVVHWRRNSCFTLCFFPRWAHFQSVIHCCYCIMERNSMCNDHSMSASLFSLPVSRGYIINLLKNSVCWSRMDRSCAFGLFHYRNVDWGVHIVPNNLRYLTSPNGG